jgi:hypothetical protein
MVPARHTRLVMVAFIRRILFLVVTFEITLLIG